MSPLFAVDLSKYEALSQLAARFTSDVVPDLENAVEQALEQIVRQLGSANPMAAQLSYRDDIGEEKTIYEAAARVLRRPQHRNGRPYCFPDEGVENAFTPRLETLSVNQGLLWRFGGMSVVLAPDGKSIARKYSSVFSDLAHFYDVNPAAVAGAARYVDGLAIVICDDCPTVQYCHWLVDWLPRLAVIGALAKRPDCYVITGPVRAQFQVESLKMCGFTSDRIIEVADGEAVRARTLLATSDLRHIPHPALKAAPWAVSYLRSTLGMGSLFATRDSARTMPRKILISRADTTGRHMVNEQEVLAALEPLGYERIVLSQWDFSEQVALFAGATHVVGIHGAGLSSVVFLLSMATVIEIFPVTYGIASFYVLTAGVENTYASYVANHIVSALRTQLDDVFIDVADFVGKCGDLL